MFAVLKQGSVAVARRAGLAVTKYPPRTSLEYHLKRLLDMLEVNCVLDVGSHVGEFAKMLRRDVGYEGHIVSFEPVSESFGTLRRAMGGDPRWTGHNYALGLSSGTSQMRVFAGTVMNSLRQPSSYALDRFPEAMQYQRSESVTVYRLADVLDRVTAHVDGPVMMLKLDTQGSDMDVLSGAGDAVGQFVALQMEASAKPLYENVSGLADTLISVGELGFEITGLFPVSLDTDNLRVIDFDCFFRRTPR